MSGLPKRCECGGKMIYTRGLGRIFSACEACTPVVTVRRPRPSPEQPTREPSAPTREE